MKTHATLLNLKQVIAHIEGAYAPFDSRQLRYLMSLGRFPAPAQIVTRKTRFWSVEEVDAWIEERKQGIPA
jgi:predicted DNA-binding transcriptional regulator AlpA